MLRLDISSLSRSRLSRAALAAALVSTALGCGSGGIPDPVEGHPRLFVTEADLPRLRGWAKASNPFYTNGIQRIAEGYRDQMDAGKLTTEGDCIASDGFLICEWFMEMFAFMSLVSPDAAERDDYAKRAKTLLMAMIEPSVDGPDPSSPNPILNPRFSTGDRSRNGGRAFGLTVDWIYPYLDGGDKEKIRTVFLRWADENVHAAITTSNHPEPVGVFNDPTLLQNQNAVRFAGNNYFVAHERNLGLMAMALDPDDDPGGELAGYLDNATGAFLYMTDALLRGDAKGGMLPEGFEYAPLTMSNVMDLLFALHTAGKDDPKKLGDQVAVKGHPFWQDVIPAYIHALSPGLHPHEFPGPYHDFPSFGDMETYEPSSGVYNDPIETFGFLGVIARDAGDQARYDTIRWIEWNMPPGGNDPNEVISRSNSLYAPHNALSYFLLMDPDADQGVDPRPSMPLDYYAEGLRFLFARTGFGQEDSYFTYQLTWTGIDHRHGDGNNFGLYRKGEWLTKEHAGYGAFTSDVHNTVSIQNDTPSHNEGVYVAIGETGSQYTYVADGDGQVLAKSVTPAYAYALGDATDLYNCTAYNQASDVAHASRSIVWLKPDHVIVYDRAATKTAGRKKSFHLQLPADPTLNGPLAAVATPGGQQLFVTSLLPAGAGMTIDPPLVDYTAAGDPMITRVTVSSTATSERFLHVLQGADAGASADPATLVASTGGAPFDGAVVKGTLIAFPVDVAAPFAGVTFDVPDTTTTFLITGLTPGASFDVTLSPPSGGLITLTIQPGSSEQADDGGVLAL